MTCSAAASTQFAPFSAHLALGHVHEGRSVSEVAASVRLTFKAVREIGPRYDDAGLEQARTIGPVWRRTPAGGRPATTHYRHVVSDPLEGHARLDSPIGGCRGC